MMENITPIIVAFLGSGIWTVILEFIRQRATKKTADKQMLLGLGHDRIFSLCEQYLERGYVTLDELENLEYIFNPYKELGGNGTGERLYEAVNKLPHTPQKKED